MIQAPKNEQSNLQSSYWFPKGVLAIGNQLAACRIRALIAPKPKQVGTIFLAFHSAVHPWRNTGIGAYKLMQQTLWPEPPRDWPSFKKECVRTAYITFLFFFICWLNILPRLNLKRAKFHPLSKKSSSGFCFCFTVSKKGMCFHLPNTFISVFMDIWRCEILPIFHLMSPSSPFFLFFFLTT